MNREKKKLREVGEKICKQLYVVRLLNESIKIKCLKFKGVSHLYLANCMIYVHIYYTRCVCTYRSLAISYSRIIESMCNLCLGQERSKINQQHVCSAENDVECQYCYKYLIRDDGSRLYYLNVRSFGDSFVYL